jgi:hypothetical protein
MQPDEVAVGAGYEQGLAARGPLGWYMRWYLRRRRPIEAGFTQTGPYKVRRPWRMPVAFEGAVATRE